MSTEEIIQAIQEKSSEGVAPHSREDNKLYWHVHQQFDSWEEACEAAGVTPLKEHLEDPMTEEDIIQAIQQKAEEGVAPSCKKHSQLYSAAMYRFGSWTDACEAAGLITKKEDREWTRDKLIRQIREDAEDGVAPSVEDVSYKSAAQERFGTWIDFCETAGVTPAIKDKKWSKDTVIEEIQQRAEDGVAPSTSNHIKLSSAARKYFSSWREACEAAGVTPKREA